VNDRTYDGSGHYCGRRDGGSNCNRVVTAAATVVTTTAVVVIVDVDIDVTVDIDVRVPIYVRVAIDVGLGSTAIVAAAMTLGGKRRFRKQYGDGEEGGDWTGPLHSVSLFVRPGGLGIDLCDGDAVSVGRRIEGESVLAKGGREVPAKNLAVLRLCVVGESSDHELSRKRKLS
jgi:hypothetical protein